MDKYIFRPKNDGNLEIWKKDQGSTYVVATMGVMTTRLGRGGKAAVGGYWGEVVKGPHYMLPVLEW